MYGPPTVSSITPEQVRENARRLKYEAVRAKRFAKEARQREETFSSMNPTAAQVEREKSREQEAFTRGQNRIKVDDNDPYKTFVASGIASRPAAIAWYHATRGGPIKLAKFITDSLQTALRTTFGDQYKQVLERAGVTENDALKHVYDRIAENEKKQFPFLASKMSLPEQVAEAAGDFVGNTLPKLTALTMLTGGAAAAVGLPAAVAGPAAFAADAAMTAFNRGASLKEGAIEGAKGALLGGILHTTNPLSLGPRLLAQGGTMALDAAMQGAPAKEVLKAGVIGGGFALTGGTKGITAGQLAGNAADLFTRDARRYRKAEQAYNAAKAKAHQEWYGTSQPDEPIIPANKILGDAERQKVEKFYAEINRKDTEQGPPTPIIPPSPDRPDVKWSEEEQRWKADAPEPAPQEPELSPQERWARAEDERTRNHINAAVNNPDLPEEVRQDRAARLASFEAKTPKTTAEMMTDLAALGQDPDLDKFVRRAYGIPKPERQPYASKPSEVSVPDAPETLPLVDRTSSVSGLVVRDHVPNMGSIAASFSTYDTLPGIREVPMRVFDQRKPEYYSQSEKTRTLRLAEEIKANKEINPLIVVHDNEGYYILEGGHRFDALQELGVESFPAVVVRDLDSPLPHPEMVAERPPPPGTPTDIASARLSPSEVAAARDSDLSHQMRAYADRLYVDDPEYEIGHAPLITAPGIMESQLHPVKGTWAFNTQNVPPLGDTHGMELKPNMTDQRQPGTQPASRAIDPSELTNRLQIADRIREAFDILFVPGKIRAPGMRSAKSTLGWMNPVGWYARVRSMKDVGTIAHEAAHALDSILFATKDPTLVYERSPAGYPTRKMIHPDRWKPWAHELDPLASPSNMAAGITHEGFAEYVSYYVLNKAFAKHVAPEFTAYFEKTMQERAPEIFGALRDAGDDFHTYWERMTPMERTLVNIGMGGSSRNGTSFGTLVRGKRASARGFINDTIRAALNPNNPFRQAVIDTRGNEKRNAWGKMIPFSNVDVAENPEYLAQQLGGRTAGLVNAWLRGGRYGGRFNRRGSLALGAEGLADIIRAYDGRPLQLKAFEGYMVARRIVELYGDPKRKGIILPIDEETARATVAHYEAVDPHAVPTFDKLRDYQKDLIQFLVDHEVISQASAEKMWEANQDYVPLYALLDETFMPRGSGSGSGSSSLGKLKNPIRGLRGGDVNRLAPLEGIIKNTIHFLNIGLRNELGLSLEKLSKLPNGGLHVRPVVRPNAPIKVQREELIQHLKKNLDPTSPAYAALEQAYPMPGAAGGKPVLDEKAAFEDLVPDEILHVFRPADFNSKDMVIPVMKNGKQIFLEVNQDLWDVANGLPKVQMSMLMKFLALPAKSLRAGATGLNIEFGLKNLTRDQAFAFINSKNSKVPLLNMVNGVYHLMRGRFVGDELYQKASAMGIGTSAIVSMDRDALAEVAADVAGGSREAFSMDKSLRQRVQHRVQQGLSDRLKIPLPGNVNGQPNDIELGRIIAHPAQAIRSLSEYMEMITRMGSFAETYKAEQARNPGLKDYELQLRSAMGARENSVDFSVMGTSPSLRELSAVTAFLNAAIQGTRRATRSLWEDPVGVSAKVFASVLLPSAVAWWYSKDDGQVADLQEWQRQMFYCIPTRPVPKEIWRKWTSEQKAAYKENHPIIRIQRPEFFGGLGSLLEAALGDAYQTDPKVGSRLDKWFELTKGDLIQNKSPTAVSLGLSLASNTDALSQRPIIPGGLVNLTIDPIEKRTPGTSPTAIDITKLYNRVAPSKAAMSPIQTQYLARGVFGGLGTQALNVADYVREKAVGQTDQQASMGESPAKDFADYWGLRPFIARYPTTNAEPIQEFWDIFNKVENAHRTAKFVEEGEPERAEGLYEKNDKEIGLFPAMDKTRKQLSEMSAYLREINADKTLSAQEKRRRLDATIFDMIDLCRESVEFAKFELANGKAVP